MAAAAFGSPCFKEKLEPFSSPDFLAASLAFHNHKSP
jgi:hypothetical protein